MFTITQEAENYLSNLFIKHNKIFLRIAVTSGGCHGFSYLYDFVDSKESDDIIYDVKNGTILIDINSNDFLKNVTLDYENNLTGSSFKFNNLEQISSCGCGNSFSI